MSSEKTKEIEAEIYQETPADLPTEPLFKPIETSTKLEDQSIQLKVVNNAKAKNIIAQGIEDSLRASNLSAESSETKLNNDSTEQVSVPSSDSNLFNAGQNGTSADSSIVDELNNIPSETQMVNPKNPSIPSGNIPSELSNSQAPESLPKIDPQRRANNAQNVGGVNPFRDRDYNNRRNQEINRQTKAGNQEELGGEKEVKDPTDKQNYHKASANADPNDPATNSKKEQLKNQVEEAKRKGASFNQKKNQVLHPIQNYKNKQKIKKQQQRARRVQAAKTWIKTHPVETAVIVGVILLVAIFVMMILIILLSGEGQGSADTKAGWNCTYSAGSDTYEDLQVELVNCNATKSNYTVLETISFEQYVLGVALAEAGESTSDEALKAQMIAVRNFALNRNKTMCPSNPNNCFYGYNSESNIIRMRACTNDQVYWDYTEDIYRVPQSVALYSPEVNSSTPGAVLWKKALSSERQAEVEALASEVVGKTLTDANGNISKIDFTSVETDKFIALANSGQDYTQILLNVYGTNNTISSSSCDYSEVSEGVVASGDYANWRQTDPRWSSTRIGTCTVGRVGCLITAVSIQVARSGAKTTLPEFNPGTFASALNRNGGVASNCNFMGVNYVKKIVPSITQPYNDRIYGYSKSQILSYVKRRIEEGCHLVIEVKGHGTRSSVGQHWVAIDDLSTKNSNYTKLYMWDPATKSTDLFAKYGNRITVAKCFKFD